MGFEPLRERQQPSEPGPRGGVGEGDKSSPLGKIFDFKILFEIYLAELPSIYTLEGQRPRRITKSRILEYKVMLSSTKRY